MENSGQVNENQVKKFYDDVYRDGNIRDNDKFYAWIAGMLGLKDGDNFLDVACGGGWMLRAGADKGARVCGLDISPNAVQKARELVPGAEVVAGSGEQLPWSDNVFDHVSCLGSLEHFVNPQNGVGEIFRVLKKGGTCAILLPNKYAFGDLVKVWRTGDCEEPWQILERSATREEWRRFIEASGLKVKKVFKSNKYPEFFKPGTFKLKSIKKFIETSFVKYCVPFNFAWQFVYLCEK